MAVSYQMSSLGTRICKTQTIYNIVESAFQQDKEIGTFDSFFAFGFLKKQMKLFLGEAIYPFNFLLFPELNAIVGNLSSPTLAVFAWGITAPVKCALIRITTISLKK